MEKISECVGEYTIICSFRKVEDHFTWAFAGVYGPNSDGARRLLWDELANLLSWWNITWWIGGDLNVTHFPSETSREGQFSPTKTEFSYFIFYQVLIDLPLVRGMFPR